jgi:hypothetical protein
MRTSKQKPVEHYQSVRTIFSQQLPPTLEQVRERAHDIYLAHGGAERMMMDDWLVVEQELKRQLEDETSMAPKTFQAPE